MWIAQQITPRARRWLRISRSARVLHLFTEACTLVNERDELLALVSLAVGPGPFTVVIESGFTSSLDVGQRVTIDNQQETLTIGPLCVRAREAEIWSARPDWSRLRQADARGWPSPAELPPDIETYLAEALRGIVTVDRPLFRAGVAGLAGRGGGLTPTGDDVLMGILYGLWVWHRRREWMDAVVQTAVPRTTVLSAAFIRAAAAGEAVWQWHDLAAGRPGAVDRLLAIGHASGADAWAGFTHTRLALGATPVN
jgi:hypothetical protein